MISVQIIITQCLPIRFHSISVDMNQVIVWSHVELFFAIASHIIGLFISLEKLSYVNVLIII